MFEVWQWITLGILWTCVAANVCCIVSNRRLRRKSWCDIERYEKTVGKLILRGDEVVGLLNGQETVYIQKDIAKVMRNLARRNAINEFYDAINLNASWNTIEGKSDEYTDGYCAAVAWYNEMVLKAKNDMLGDLTELSE